jgi:hypothetical protein
MNEPIPVKTILLEYAQNERRRCHLAPFLRRLMRPAIYLMVGLAVGALVGLVLSPPVTYLDYGMIRLAMPRISGDAEMRHRAWQEYLATRNKVLSILRDPNLADFAFNACKPTTSSVIQTPDQLRGQMTIEDISRTELIRIWIEDTDIAQMSELLKAFMLEGVERMQNHQIDNLTVITESERPIGVPTRDKRRIYATWGAVMGGLIALLMLRPVRQ